MALKQQTVTVPNAAFIFCRWSVALMLWSAFLFRVKPLVALAFAILALSAILTVRRAPLIALYAATLGRVIPSQPVELLVSAMRFAHSLGALFALVCLAILYLGNERVGWAVLLVFCMMKTVSAAGFCPASKLYGCLASGGCCALSRKSP